MSLEYARLITKGGSGVATIPPSPSHENGDWISTDIYENELYLDVDTGKIYTNIEGVIFELNPTAPLAENFALNDLTLDADRSHDFDGFAMEWIGISEFRQEATSAPTIGNASFTSIGYGSLSTDKTHVLETGAGVAHEWFGDLSQKVYGTCDISGINRRIFGSDYNVYMRKSPAANGIEISAAGGGGGVKGVWTFGYNDGEIVATGNLGGDSIGLYSSSSNNYTVHSDSAGNVAWRSGKMGNDYNIRGNLGGGYSGTNIFKIAQTDGEIEFLLGKLKGLLQVGNAGLTTGQWYQDTSANVLLNSDLVIAVKQ